MDEMIFNEIIFKSLKSLYGVVRGSINFDLLFISDKLSNGIQNIGLKLHQEWVYVFKFLIYTNHNYSDAVIFKNSISFSTLNDSTYSNSSFKLSIQLSGYTPLIFSQITQKDFIEAQLNKLIWIYFYF